MFVIRPLVTNR